MIKPQYQISNKLLGNLTQIERFYGQIEALKLPQELMLNLERHNLVKSSYASNRIEGNPLTLPEVTNLLLDDRVPTNRDEKEVVNYFNILKSLDSFHDHQLSLSLIKDFHKELMTGVDKSAGIIRNSKVVIGKYSDEKGNVSLKVKHDPPYHTREEIEKYLKEIVDWYNYEGNIPVIIKAGIFHHEFVYVHPFEDGNGRICRILTSLIFIKNNYRINRYFVLDDYYDIDRTEYSDMLHSADMGDKTKWLEYFSDGVKFSLQSALSRAKTSINSLNFELKPTPKERLVLEILQAQPNVVSSDIVSKLKVSRQQAHNLLKSLVEKGLVEKKGSTKSSFYSLK